MFKDRQHSGTFEIIDNNLGINNDMFQINNYIQEIIENLLQKENIDQTNGNTENSKIKTDNIEFSAGNSDWNFNNSDKNEDYLEIFNIPQITHESVINNTHGLNFANDNTNAKLPSSDKYDHKNNISKLNDCWATVEVLKLEIDRLINYLDGIFTNNDELEIESAINGTNSDRMQVIDAGSSAVPDISIDQMEINNNSQTNAFSEILYNGNTFCVDCFHKSDLNNLNDCLILMQNMKAEFSSLSNYFTKICVAINSCDISETQENISNFEVENTINFERMKAIIDFEEAENILSYFATIEKFLLDTEMLDNKTFYLNTYIPNKTEFNKSVNNDINSITNVFPITSNFENSVINLSNDTGKNERNETMDSCDLDNPVNFCNEIASINAHNKRTNSNEDDDVIIIEDELHEELDEDLPKVLKVVSLCSRNVLILDNSSKNTALSHSNKLSEKPKVINNIVNAKEVIIENKDLRNDRTQNLENNNNVQTASKRKLPTPFIKTYWTRSKMHCQFGNSNGINASIIEIETKTI